MDSARRPRDAILDLWQLSVGSVSSGCIRLFNQDVVDLHRRVPVGTHVTMLDADAEDGVVTSTVFTYLYCLSREDCVVHFQSLSRRRLTAKMASTCLM
jgi:hypothetical protein